MAEPLAVDIRQHGPLQARTDAITQDDVFERLEYPAGRTREFRDAITRADGALPGIPTLEKQLGHEKGI
jgi:hypothetical protein